VIIEAQQPEGIALRLSEDEIDHWNSALNEVCHGFRVANFQAAIGIPESRAIRLLERIHALVPGQPEVFEQDEVLAVRNALTTVLAELDAQEYHTRMGFAVEDSRQMRNTLDALTGQMRLVKTA
jgi:hypothetical protein